MWEFRPGGLACLITLTFQAIKCSKIELRGEVINILDLSVAIINSNLIDF